MVAMIYSLNLFELCQASAGSFFSPSAMYLLIKFVQNAKNPHFSSICPVDLRLGRTKSDMAQRDRERFESEKVRVCYTK